MVRIGTLAFCALALTGFAPQKASLTAIDEGIGKLRSMSDVARAAKTRELALAIRALPGGERKVQLASSLCNLSTEGDFGPGTLQSVADTLVGAVKASPTSADGDVYVQIANLARYEDIRVDLDTSAYRAALAKVDALERTRAKADFTLTDLAGKKWTRSALRGKVVLVNFWATWCPPCRKEMPDLSALQTRFRDRLIVLGITNESRKTVEDYLTAHPVSYRALLDPGDKVGKLYQAESIPQNLVYDRDGRLVAQSIDMRTKGQFLKLLAKAGLR